MYKKAILEMLDMIQSEKELKRIYKLVKYIYKKKDD